MSSETCPLYLGNSDSDVLGSGPIAVLSVNEADALLGIPVFLRHVRQSVRDDRFRLRRGPGLTVFSDCSDWYLLVPGFATGPDQERAGGRTAPFAVPALVAVAAGAFPPATYQRLMETQLGTGERLRHLTGTLNARARSLEAAMREARAHLIANSPDAFLGMMADEARDLWRSTKDAAKSVGAWLPWAFGALAVLVVVSRR